MKFFSDLFKRLFAKSPLFFRIIQILAVVLAGIAKLPALLSDIGFPILIQEPYATIVAACAAVAVFIAQLTVKAPEPGEKPLQLQIKS